MGSDHVIEPKGKVQPKPVQESAEHQKDDSHVTKADVQGKLDAQTLTRMQQTLGNAAVQRFLAQRQQSGPSEINDETAGAIQSKKGSGQQLEQGIAEKAGSTMGQDFGDVNVHTDSQSDSLSRELGAKAFTTGNDIFFQSGAYDPGSSDGQRLISHELTHVVQQGGGGAPVQGKMSVNDPNDAYESEADNVADTVMNAPDEATAQRVDEDEMAYEKPDPDLQRDSSDVDEGEEIVAVKLDPALQRQDIPEDVGLKPDPNLQREEAGVEEDAAHMMPDPALQRQEVPEEEPRMKEDPSLQRQIEEEPEPDPMLKGDPTLQRQDEIPEETI